MNGEKGADTQANDFIALQKLKEASWTARGVARSPLLIGPDTHSNAEYSDDGDAWFKRFVETAGAAVAFNTFHMYSLGNGPNLDPNKVRLRMCVHSLHRVLHIPPVRTPVSDDP